MLHMAYPSSQAIAAGATILTVGKPINSGDDIAVEYPNNQREAGKVLRCSHNLLEIEVSGRQWALIPLNPKETVDINTKSDPMASVTWTVQQSR